jgi:hypothetical protein
MLWFVFSSNHSGIILYMLASATVVTPATGREQHQGRQQHPGSKERCNTRNKRNVNNTKGARIAGTPQTTGTDAIISKDISNSMVESCPGPVRNAFDAGSIFYEGKWEGVGPWKLSVLWAL